MFSDPQILAEVVTGPRGSAEYRIAVLADLPPGPHTVTVIGVAPDGSDLVRVVPIVVAANGSLADVRLGDGNAVVVPAVPSVVVPPVAPAAPVAPEVTPSPEFRPSSGPLPATGSTSATTLSLAACSACGLLGLLGLLRWFASRQQRAPVR